MLFVSGRAQNLEHQNIYMPTKPDRTDTPYLKKIKAVILKEQTQVNRSIFYHYIAYYLSLKIWKLQGLFSCY